MPSCLNYFPVCLFYISPCLSHIACSLCFHACFIAVCVSVIHLLTPVKHVSIVYISLCLIYNFTAHYPPHCTFYASHQVCSSFLCPFHTFFLLFLPLSMPILHLSVLVTYLSACYLPRYIFPLTGSIISWLLHVLGIKHDVKSVPFTMVPLA